MTTEQVIDFIKLHYANTQKEEDVIADSEAVTAIITHPDAIKIFKTDLDDNTTISEHIAGGLKMSMFIPENTSPEVVSYIIGDDLDGMEFFGSGSSGKSKKVMLLSELVNLCDNAIAE